MSENAGADVRPQIDGYALLDIAPAIGRTARVYKGVSLADGGLVAIKVLTASVDQSVFLEEVFRRETQSFTELRHPHILTMHRSGITAAGDRYLVLDWMSSDLVAWKSTQKPFEWATFWHAVGRPLVSAKPA